MVDDDDGVGLGTDGPLISLKTHEDSRAEGGGRSGTLPRGESLPPQVSARPSSLHGGPRTVLTTICPTYMHTHVRP